MDELSYEELQERMNGTTPKKIMNEWHSISDAT
jgi:hypothetical protein